MKAAVLSFAFFLYWSLLGAAFLHALYSRRNLLRNLLLAPVMGASLVLLPTFWINRLGIPVGRFGRPLAAALLAAALILLWLCRRKPLIPWRKALPFALLLVMAFLLTGSPMFEFGSNWLSYGNNDMANYVLGAHRFLNFGYFDIPNPDMFAENRDATLHYWFMHVPDGYRSGSELTVSFAVALTGIDGFRVFMPVIFALHLSLIAAGAGLILTSRQRRLTALLAAALMAVCALLTLGVVYQLIAQVFGMALLACGASFILRPFPRLSWRRTLGQAIVIAVNLTALAVTYPEIVPFLVVAFLAWHGVALYRSRAWLRDALPLWGLALLLMCLMMNSYLHDSVNFLLEQSTADSRGYSRTETLFPFYLIPSGLANLWSLLGIAQPNTPLELNAKVAAGGLLTLLLVFLAIRWTRRREPVAMVALVMLLVGAGLYVKTSNFGLYKLAMFIQPFLIGTVSLSLAAYSQRSRRLNWAGWAACAVLAGFSLDTQHYYVDRSRGAHGGLLEVPGASATRLLDEARALASAVPASARLNGDTFNVVVAKIQGLYLRPRPMEFICRDFFPQFRYSHFFTRYVPQRRGISDPQLGALANRLADYRLKRYKMTPFDMKAPGAEQNEFLWNPTARELPVTDPQYLLVSTGRQGFVNRRRYPGGEANFQLVPMSAVHDHLVFVSSYLGQSYYMEDRHHAAFFQLEPDLAFPGRTMSSTGRHILFEILKPSPGGRLLFDFSSTWNADHDNSLPPAEVVGDRRYRLPLHGRGAARVVSPPITPQHIGALDYIDLDMGREGKTIDAPRTGLMRLYGSDVLLDIRWITGFARDISYLSEEEYQRMQPPAGIWSFPDGLLPPDLEYSGIYEDGWVSEDSTYTLTQTPERPELAVSGFIPKIGASTAAAEGVLAVDGAEVSRRVLPRGDFEWRVPVAFRPGRREVELKFSRLEHLPGPDNRPVAAKLRSIGFEGAALEREDIITKEGPVTLGAGWYPGEKFGGQVFRWVNNDAIFTTGMASEIEMEPGPGVSQLPARVEILGAGGAVLKKELRGREIVHLENASTYRIHIANGGAKTAADPRILNLRVFRIAPPGARPGADIALNGVWLGKGWYDVETQNGRRFRWADTNSEFRLKGPGKVRLEIEPGPSLGAAEFQLRIIDASGRAVKTLRVRGHKKLDLDLAGSWPGGGLYRLAVDSQRKPVPNDPRTLNFRVWEMSLQAP